MSNNKVQEYDQFNFMKTVFRSTLFIGVLITLLFGSCKKNADVVALNPTMVLTESKVFKNYVVNDLLQSTNYYLHDVSLMNPSTLANFREDLSRTREENLSNVFSKYHLNFQLFKQFQVNRMVNQMLVLSHFPDIANLPENEIDKIFKDAYSVVSNRMIQQLKKNEKNYPKKNFRQTAVSSNEYQNKLGINTVRNLNSEFYFGIEENLSLSDEMAEELIYSQIYNYAVNHSITFGEAMDCLAHAFGWGGGSMGSIVGWSKAIAGLAIQEAVTVATRWALMHIGWLGLAVTTFTLTSCLINAY